LYPKYFPILEAVHRYYESRRRLLYNDKKLERKDKVAINKKTRISQGQRRVSIVCFCDIFV